MDYCDCEFCNVIPTSLTLRGAGVAPASLPRPRPIRPSPYGLEFPTVIQQFNAVAASSAIIPTIPATVALRALPPAVPSTSTTVIHSMVVNSAGDSTSTPTTVNNGSDDKTFKHRTWYNKETENDTKSFRDFLKMAACEFKRSIEPSFDETAGKSKKENEKTVKAKRQKRPKTEAKLTRTDSAGDAAPAESFDAPLSLGSDRFSPSSVSCASIDSGFADSIYPPSSPESGGTVPTSFAPAASSIESEAAMGLLKRPLDENNNNVDDKEQIQNPEEEIENKILLAPDSICFAERDNDKHDDLETLEPLAKVRRISDVFFNSQTSEFVNNLLKRSRQTSENEDGDETVDSTIVANCSKKVRFAIPDERAAEAEPITIRQADKLCVSATISTRKAAAEPPVDEKEITKLYLSAEMQPIILISEKIVHDDIDRFNLASTSTAGDISPAVSLSDEASRDSVDDPTTLECACQWQGCERRFRTDNQLYDHVLGCHLEVIRPAVKELQPAKLLTRQKSKNGRKAAETSLFCKWDQCTMCLKRGDPKKQFEWLIEHYTTRHAPRAQPFACLFGDCNLRFRTRRTLNDHLLSAHDSEKPNGKRNSNINNSCTLEPTSHCYNYSPLVRVPCLTDMIDRRTMTWMRTQLALKNSAEPYATRQQYTPADVPHLTASRAAMRKMRISSVKYMCTIDAKSNGLKSQEPRHDVSLRKMNKDQKASLLLELCRSPKTRLTPAAAVLCV